MVLDTYEIKMEELVIVSVFTDKKLVYYENTYDFISEWKLRP
jgi:hypothetical protein